MNGSRSARTAAVLALAAGTLLAGAAPSRADVPHVKDFPGCRAYGSASGFGIACAGPGGSGTSLRDYLGHDLPECWDEDPPATFVPPRTIPGARWWLHVCLSGLDLHTLDVRPGGLSLAYGYVPLVPGVEHHLTVEERYVVDRLLVQGQVPIPFPRVRVSPSSSPRVGEVVAFSLDGATTAGPLTRGGISMTARVVSLMVEPLGEGGPRTTCTGAGRPIDTAEVQRAGGDPAALGADVCAWRYDRSSYRAGVGDAPDRYPVRVTASWAITYTRGADSGVLGPFDTSAVNQVRVAEVQTLVVS